MQTYGTHYLNILNQYFIVRILKIHQKMARTKTQMQRMPMRMKHPLKNDISLCTTFCKDEFRALSSI